MPEKLRYEIDLTGRAVADEIGDLPLRRLTGEDVEGLAGFMLDAYRGTIDYEDEDLDDARDEVRSFFDRANHPLFEHSRAVEVDGRLASAILISIYEGDAFIRAVMTSPEHKNEGLARRVTVAALESLTAAGYEKVVLYITDGTRPSEALFDAVGAVHVEE